MTSMTILLLTLNILMGKFFSSINFIKELQLLVLYGMVLYQNIVCGHLFISNVFIFYIEIHYKL